MGSFLTGRLRPEDISERAPSKNFFQKTQAPADTRRSFFLSLFWSFGIDSSSETKDPSAPGLDSPEPSLTRA